MERTYPVETNSVESAQPAVSWGAIFVGALAASTVSVILMLIGSGIGLTIVSPWPGQGSGITAFAATTAVGLIIVQWVSAGVGGYLAGRLRTKWVAVRSDEVFFRDTVHGFMAWAVATLLMFGVLGSGLTSTVSGGAHAASNVASGALAGVSAAAGNDGANGSLGYLVDNLMRPGSLPANTESSAGIESRAQIIGEVSRILTESTASGSIADDEKNYLAQLIASNTGISESDANKRIDAGLTRIENAKTQAREAADTARKAGAALALASALALLVGAFIASAAAALAGQQRDEENNTVALA
ncbi:hypothetical protein ACO34A_23965 (plasmid) [Rhizobium sp. ACO-34A]|nr:hypothetical protein [Rhizobium sp. ACO-34A]ATN36836.1 hypothetical protein ACO34A_23965 [Rhizobium sp. ACO-34A]